MAGVWAIDGVEVPASVARMLAYVAGGGAEGIVEPGGLKVEPLAVPGSSVRVMPGAGMVMNRYPGGGQQSYPIYEQVQQTVPIVATGSGGGRTDLVIARVSDPEYAGVEAGVTFEVVQGVPAGVTADYAATLGYPALALAKVTLPASTATVRAGMINDLRRLARPRTRRDVAMGIPAAGVDLVSAGGVQWPSFRPSVDVPAWATHANLFVDLTGLWHQGNSVSGVLHLTLGSGSARWTVDQPYHVDTTVGGGERMDIRLGIPVEVPLAFRGAAHVLGIEARREAGTGYLTTRQGTRVIFDVEWLEKAV